MRKFFKTVSYPAAIAMGPRKFVKDYLFPAMRREHGKGFAMSTWIRDIGDLLPGDEPFEYFDNLSVEDRGGVPVCNSVMCIGGTMQTILGEFNEARLAAVLGLPKFSVTDDFDGEALFYRYEENRGPWFGLSEAFEKATTPHDKEQIAEKAVMAAVEHVEKLQTTRRPK